MWGCPACLLGSISGLCRNRYALNAQNVYQYGLLARRNDIRATLTLSTIVSATKLYFKSKWQVICQIIRLRGDAEVAISVQGRDGTWSDVFEHYFLMNKITTLKRRKGSSDKNVTIEGSDESTKEQITYLSRRVTKTFYNTPVPTRLALLNPLRLLHSRGLFV